MNTRIYAFISSSVKSARRIAISLPWILISSCGPQDPSFTEHASELENSDDLKVEIPDPTSESIEPTKEEEAKKPEICTDRDPEEPTKEGGEEVTPDQYALTSDSFTQKSNSKVDILWIVDNSGSMREEQTYLGQNFSSFINKISTSQVDFQIGVTSTDVCDSGPISNIPLERRYCPASESSTGTHHRGTLIGDTGKKVLTSTTSDLQSRFLRYAAIGTNGSSFEHGLTAAKMAIEKAKSGQNEGLIRPDAFLAVIVVSDEEDDGIGLGITDLYTGNNYFERGLTQYKYTTDDFIRDATTAKGAGKFSVSTITGVKNSNGTMCTSPHSQPKEEGSQYISAARKTGGVVQSICETNWSNSLATIGQDISAQSSQVVLTKKPHIPSIKVIVNGVQNQNWTYVAGTNAIKFNNGQVPAAGAVIKVEYRILP